MNIETLKSKKSEIVERIIELGCEAKLKTFMEIMVMNANYFKGENVMDFVNETFNTNFRERAKKSGHMIAEICGNGIKSNGTERDYSTTKYL